MDGNYIKVSRGILDWEWWSDINTTRVFLYMLIKANWKDGKFKGIDIPRGSFVASIASIAQGTSLTQDEVRTAIKHLISSQTITKQSTNKYTVFSVLNYELYQDVSQADTKQIPSYSQAIPNDRRKKEGKKGNKEKNTKKEFFPDNRIIDQAFSDYVDMRKQIRAPMTDRAIEMAIKKLTVLSGGDPDVAVKILEQSIMNSWKGLFPLNDHKPPEKKNAFNNCTPRDHDYGDLESRLLNNGCLRKM